MRNNGDDWAFFISNNGLKKDQNEVSGFLFFTDKIC